MFLEISQISQENTWTRVSFLITLQAWGLCEISKNNFFTEHPQATASVWWCHTKSYNIWLMASFDLSHLTTRFYNTFSWSALFIYAKSYIFDAIYLLINCNLFLGMMLVFSFFEHKDRIKLSTVNFGIVLVTKPYPVWPAALGATATWRTNEFENLLGQGTQKWSFPSRISSVNVTKCTVLMENFIFCAVNVILD